MSKKGPDTLPVESITKQFFNSDQRGETIVPEIAKGLLEKFSQ